MKYLSVLILFFPFISNADVISLQITDSTKVCMLKSGDCEFSEQTIESTLYTDIPSEIKNLYQASSNQDDLIVEKNVQFQNIINLVGDSRRERNLNIDRACSVGWVLKSNMVTSDPTLQSIHCSLLKPGYKFGKTRAYDLMDRTLSHSLVIKVLKNEPNDSLLK